MGRVLGTYSLKVCFFPNMQPYQYFTIDLLFIAHVFSITVILTCNVYLHITIICVLVVELLHRPSE